ncbi:penicillin acylase family protein [Cellulomonas fimi]|uniref:Peptidase S45 penicillin amidase n=1 Tax=Cellulomonas fimi (strain ATCC 484 / DSM 20113 / JCM 1341 / CCUG 24087 / LMG 16345 / NBRC 15513 / NCIMB 8980 / NCTC 7547 / NRS-133) TaxID=590998 RepID=F4GZ93_CELFA|nr:peptidase S45 penicillin amidase [Cellulomonas fimi ATCC 484]NNH08470.1 penicillin acylase family protein [Cellulomonas fimi]VEH35594.1 Acyl-homoserine lactone acylase quiP precursor [Cellulomonas fimi]
MITGRPSRTFRRSGGRAAQDPAAGRLGRLRLGRADRDKYPRTVSRLRLVRVALATVAAVLVLALVATAVVAVVVVRRPLPEVSGELALPGLDADVTVTRDPRGVPTITATTTEDLFRAQGYVAAQDRFFEMDYRRHVTSGRLSELVGENEDALAADKVIRTFGWRRVAEQEWDILDPSTRDALQAYADGVNAYLSTRDPSQVAVEYAVLGLRLHTPAPREWDPVDSLAWLKALAWDLRGNYDDELARAQTFASVQDVARVEQLFPAYADDVNAPILSADELATTATRTAATTELDLTDDGLQSALASAQEALDAVPHLVGDGAGVGSNSWVVDGRFTESGGPLLANDPHLGISAPGIWAQVALRCAEVTAQCPYDVSGFSNAGMPGVVIGHNADLAWGLTNMGADVTDFFLEKVEGDVTVRDGETAPVRERTETISVNGGEDVELTVRETVHGPIVSDVLGVDAVQDAPRPEDAPGRQLEVALAWTALQPGHTADALLAMARARDADDVAEVAALLEVPAQNIVFATTDGHIGYQAPGRIPVRSTVTGGAVPSDGTWPRPGWDSAYDWQGYVDPADMPRALDPAEGFVVAANQAVTPTGVGPFLTKDWDYGYRSQRIRTLLEERLATGEPLDVEDMAQIQADQRNPYAEALVPTLLELPIDDAFDDDGQELLRDWDLVSDTDSAAAAYFAAVWRTLLRLAFDDELPDDASPTGDSRWLEVVRRLVADPSSPWWDDRSTPGVVEGRDEILTRAMVSARRQLTTQLGRDAEDWRWGMMHVAEPEHPVLGGPSLPGLVRSFVNPSPLSVGGGSSIVDATAWDASTPSYAVTAAPSMRMVVDLGDLDASTWVTLTGTSGHPASVHYTDQFEEWATGRTFPWPFTRESTDADAKDRLTLVPAS